MKSLAERHAARAQRKVDNAVESSLAPGGGIGHAATAIASANAAVAALSDEQREELKAVIESDGFNSVVNDIDPAAMAGIGVVNPLVTPAGTAAELAATDAQQGKLPEASFDPAQGNINGQAVEAASGAGNGWGKDGQADAKDEGKKSGAKTEAK